MDKNKLKYVIDIGLVITFFSVFIGGIIKFPGLLRFIGISQRYLPMYEINLIHEWGGLTMGILVIIHLILNWKWLVAMTKRFLKK